MKIQMKTLLAFACAALTAAGAYAGQAKPAAPAQTAPAPTAPPRLMPALHGEAQLARTAPVVKREGKNIITKFKVKNNSKQPIAGLKIEEFWYDAKGTVVNGDTFRNPKPLQPDQVIEITLTDASNGKEQTNNYKFTHSNGTVKPTLVPKL
jgi:hypothetical protein